MTDNKAISFSFKLSKNYYGIWFGSDGGFELTPGGYHVDWCDDRDFIDKDMLTEKGLRRPLYRLLDTVVVYWLWWAFEVDVHKLWSAFVEADLDGD